MGLEKQHLLDNISNVKVPFTEMSTFSLPDPILDNMSFFIFDILWRSLFILIVNCPTVGDK